MYGEVIYHKIITNYISKNKLSRKRSASAKTSRRYLNDLTDGESDYEPSEEDMATDSESSHSSDSEQEESVIVTRLIQKQPGKFLVNFQKDEN